MVKQYLHFPIRNLYTLQGTQLVIFCTVFDYTVDNFVYRVSEYTVDNFVYCVSLSEYTVDNFMFCVSEYNVHSHL
jgi:hypothetical protein